MLGKIARITWRWSVAVLALGVVASLNPDGKVNWLFIGTLFVACVAAVCSECDD